MANLMTPRFWKKKAILLKLEGAGAYGVSTVATGAANWIEARNVTVTPMETDKVARNIDLPYMGSSGNVNVGFWAKLGFDVALTTSGALGVEPKWAPLLMACGMSKTVSAGVSVTFNLVGSAFSSLCGLINIDGIIHEMLGMRGEVKCKMGAKGTPMLSFSFDAIYVAPVDGALPAVTRTGWTIEEGVNSVNTSPFTLDGIDLAFSSFEWAFGNKVSRIDLPGPQKEITIDDRASTSSVTVLAPLLADFNPFTYVESGETVALSVTHGSAAGKFFQQDLNVRVLGVDHDKIDDKAAWKLTLEPTPVNGNDEFTFTCL